MKYFFIIIILTALSCSDADAQCDTLYKLNNDKFNKNISYTLVKPIISYDSYDSKKAIVILTNISKQGIYLAINTTENYCTNNNKKCLFLFEDETVFEDQIINTFNCKGEFHFAIFKDKKNSIFFNKKIIAIRLFTIDQTIDYELNNEVSQQLFNAMNCNFKF